MKLRLYVYTGTGNSLWVARQLASQLKGAGIEFMPNPKKPFKVQADAVGIVFPVHIWGLPARVIQFVNHLKVKPGTFLFAVAVNAGQPAATLVQLKRLMAAHHLPLSLGYSIVLPSNYIPWGGPGPMDAQQQRFKQARAKVRVHASAVLRGSGQGWTGGLRGRISSFPGSIRSLSGMCARWTRNSGWTINATTAGSVQRSARRRMSRCARANRRGYTVASSALPACNGARRRRSSMGRRHPATSATATPKFIYKICLIRQRRTDNNNEDTDLNQDQDLLIWSHLMLAAARPV